MNKEHMVYVCIYITYVCVCVWVCGCVWGVCMGVWVCVGVWRVDLKSIMLSEINQRKTDTE